MVPVVYCRFSRREDVEEHEAQDQDDNQDGDAGFARSLLDMCLHTARAFLLFGPPRWVAV